MDVPILAEAARELFCICAAVAVMELLAGEGSASRPFRALCALAATACALRMFARLL